MIRVVDKWLVRQLAFASFIVTVVMSVPAILISLFTNLPGDALYTYLVWPSLNSIAPMILCHTLPVLVPTAIIWCYGRYSTDGTLVTLHLTGRSILSVRAPGLLVAMGAVLIGYALTNFVVPRTSSHLHDVLYAIRNKLEPALLKDGQYNELHHKNVVIYFRKRNGNEFNDIYILQRISSAEEKAYRARIGILKRNDVENGFLLLNGSLQIYRPEKELQIVNFERLTLPLTDFDNPERNYRIVDELDTLDFLRASKPAFRSPDSTEARNWLREAVKRFALPGTALLYAWLGLELLTASGVMTDRRHDRVSLICAEIALLHFLFVILTEQIGINVHWLWLVAAMLTGELLLAAVLSVSRTRTVAIPP